VHKRTIRRDIDALYRAGFALYGEKVNGMSMWKLRAWPIGRLEETGRSVMEMCALHFSRTMLDSLTGTPLLDEAERAFMKIGKVRPRASRKFLDDLSRTPRAKAQEAGRQELPRDPGARV
jgi:predicted DNA-binding transcriptional regulator YafY